MHSLAFLQSPISILLNVDLDSLDVDDVAPYTIKLSDAIRYASLVFSFLLKILCILVLIKLFIFKS